MHALDFETVSRKHDEFLLLQMVDIWERYNNIRHEIPKTLKERWNYFIACTDALAEERAKARAAAAA